MNIRLGSICFAALVGSLVPLCSDAQQYTLTVIAGPSGTYTLASAINSKGQVAGTLNFLNGQPSQAFVTDAVTGAVVNLGSLAANRAAVGYGINDNGKVVGESYGTDPYTYYAFITDPIPFSMISLGTLGGSASIAYGINAIGQVTGVSATTGNAQAVAFITNTTTNAMTSLGTVGGTHSVGYGINRQGQVTGYSYTAGNTAYHAFVTSPTTQVMTDLGTLGGASSYGNAINDAGQVTGKSDTLQNGQYHAFITDPITNQMTDLGGLGGNNHSSGLAINSKGEVVGEADISTDSSAVLMTGFLYANGTMVDLNSLIPASDQSTYRIIQAKGINDKSEIAATATVLATRQQVAVLLSPANVAPTVQPTYAGTAGTNGWFRSAVTLSWTVAGLPAPTTVGCGTVAVATDTKGRVFTCTATNSVGTATQSVTVKVDKLSPVATITSPQASTQKTYSRNQVVSAKYTCSDLMSGVASCVGSVANGARVATSTLGTYSFVVTATDKAGNTSTKTVVYRVR